MHTVKSCKEQKRGLIVLKHPPDLIGHPKAHGNAQLISEKQADIVFENEEDIDLVMIEMNRVRNELLMHQGKKENNRTNSTQMTLD